MTRLHTALACLLLLHALPASAQPRWTIVTSETLTVIGDTPPRTLRDVAVQLEQFREVVGSVFRDANRGPSLPTVVYVFSSRRRMRDYMPRIDGKVVSASGMTARDGELNRILMSIEERESARLAFHEYTHLLTGNTGRQLPVWLNEGLAEFYSSYTLTDGGRTADIGRPLVSSILLLRGRWLPLAEILAVRSSLYHESSERTVFYPQAWALVHYLITQTPRGAEAIGRYVDHLDAGLSDNDAFAKAFGDSVASMEEKVRAYVYRDVFSAKRIRFSEAIVAAAPSEPRALTAAEADAWLGDLQRTEQLTTGEARIESAAANEPERAITQLALARLRSEQGRLGDARQALTRAAQLAPDDFLVQWSNAFHRLRIDPMLIESETVAALRRVAVMRPESADKQALQRLEAMEAQQAATRAAAVARAAAAATAAATAPPPPAPPVTVTAQPPIWNNPRGAIAAGGDTFVLRRPRRGESVARGTLLRLECLRGLVRFYVRTADRTIAARAIRTEDVEMRIYGKAAFRPLGCTPRTPPDDVVLTWSPDSGATGRTRGVAIAVEFLPPSAKR